MGMVVGVVVLVLRISSASSEYGGGGKGRLYTHRYIVTTRITPALRRAAMRGHCNVSEIVRDKVTTRQVSTNHNLFEEKGEPKRNQDNDVDRV